MFDIDETGVNWLNTHVVAIGQRIVEGDLVVIVVLVRLVRLFSKNRICSKNKPNLTSSFPTGPISGFFNISRPSSPFKNEPGNALKGAGPPVSATRVVDKVRRARQRRSILI